MAGRDRRHAVYWFDRKRGEFVTSAAYEPPPAARSVVTAYNSSRGGAAIRDRFGTRWPRLPLPAVPPTAPGAQPVPGPALFDFQIPDNGLGFDHDLTLHPDDYLGSLYISPFIDDLVADLTLAFLHDERLALGRGDAPDLLTVGFSAQDVVSHSYGNESEENLDVLRRLDLHVGRLLEALEGLGPRGTVALALSADHGFLVIPEAEKKRNPAFHGGRLVDSERTMPSFTARLNRLVAEELCVDPATRPVFGVESWALAYNRPALPLRTLGGRCGPAGEPVTAASIDAVLPGVVGRFYKEELPGGPARLAAGPLARRRPGRPLRPERLRRGTFGRRPPDPPPRGAHALGPRARLGTRFPLRLRYPCAADLSGAPDSRPSGPTRTRAPTTSHPRSGTSSASPFPTRWAAACCPTDERGPTSLGPGRTPGAARHRRCDRPDGVAVVVGDLQGAGGRPHPAAPDQSRGRRAGGSHGPRRPREGGPRLFGRPLHRLARRPRPRRDGPWRFSRDFTITGLAEGDVCVGDTFVIGEARVQVSQPRAPCWKLARRWRLPDLPKRVVQTGRTGWYFRVLREGLVESGQLLDSWSALTRASCSLG